jgi:hypothetical protein
MPLKIALELVMKAARHQATEHRIGDLTTEQAKAEIPRGLHQCLDYLCPGLRGREPIFIPGFRV